jgi:hypothetical protein
MEPVNATMDGRAKIAPFKLDVSVISIAEDQTVDSVSIVHASASWDLPDRSACHALVAIMALCVTSAATESKIVRVTGPAPVKMALADALMDG